MSLAGGLSLYLSFNLLVAAAWLILWWLAVAAGAALSARQWIRLHYLLLGFCLLAGASLPFFPARNLFPPVAKVWAPAGHARSAGGAEPRLTVLNSVAPLEVAKISGRCTLLVLSLFALGILRLLHGLSRLHRLKKSSFLIRRVGFTRVYSCPGLMIPLSYWLPGQANVLLPLHPVGGPRIALAHELQHHRQGDTKWLFVFWSLRQLCFLNPAIYFWSHRLQEIQEFACDEALVDQGKVDLQAYTRCLFETALTAFAAKGRPVGATALIFGGERHLLTRRIEKMHKERMSARSGVIWGLSLLSTGLIAATAFASRGLVQDRHIAFTQAREMQKRAQLPGGFPIVVNERVLKWLNYDLGTLEGRKAMHQALERLETYRPLLTAKFQQYSMPVELMALPITESGYQNLPEKRQHGAGLWMFIANSAKNFGLRVDATVDERLNPALETDAAMRYLQANNLRFSDWQLAILAYNAGESRVQEGIDKTGSRDAWSLIEAGFEGDSDYLAKVMAAILVMKNPDSLN